MENNSSVFLAFSNSLIQEKILSDLDTESLLNARYVCANWSEVGGNVLSKRNQYFKLESSSWNNRSYVREFNLQKVHWMKNNLKDLNKFWLFKKVELPFLEALESQEIRDLLIEYGHLIKKLRLVKFDAFRKKLIKGEKVPKSVIIAENCQSPHHLLHLILTSWCPSLVELSIVETLTKLLNVEQLHECNPPAAENVFQASEITTFGKNLNLESFSLKSNRYSNLFGDSIPVEYFREIMKNSPKLLNLKIAASKRVGDDLADVLMPKDEICGFYNLQHLSVPMISKSITFAEQITEDNFPKLKKLSLGYSSYYERQRLDYNVILNHKGIKQVKIITDFREDRPIGNEVPSFETVLKLVPHAVSLKLVYAHKFFDTIRMERYYLYPIVKNFCKPSDKTYGNIKELTLEVNFRCYVLRIVDFVGELCPNLEKFIVNSVDKEIMPLTLKSVVEHVLDKMRNLTFFQLFVDDGDWVEEEWDEIVKLVPETVSFRIGEKELIRHL